MSGAEHRRASAFIGGFKQLRLFHFSFINLASDRNLLVDSSAAPTDLRHGIFL